MIPHGNLCFSNVFIISVANRKVGKTDSIMILKNNILYMKWHEIFGIYPISGVCTFSPNYAISYKHIVMCLS